MNEECMGCEAENMPCRLCNAIVRIADNLDKVIAAANLDLITKATVTFLTGVLDDLGITDAGDEFESTDSGKMDS